MSLKKILSKVLIMAVCFTYTTGGLIAHADEVPTLDIDSAIDLGTDAHNKTISELEQIVKNHMNEELNNNDSTENYYRVDDVEFSQDTRDSKANALIAVNPYQWAQRDNYTLTKGSSFNYGAGIGGFEVSGSYEASVTQSFTINYKNADSTPGVFATVNTVRVSYSLVDSETNKVIDTRAVYKMTVGSQSVRMVYCDSTSGLIYYSNSSGAKTYTEVPHFNKSTGVIFSYYGKRQ